MDAAAADFLGNLDKGVANEPYACLLAGLLHLQSQPAVCVGGQIFFPQNQHVHHALESQGLFRQRHRAQMPIGDGDAFKGTHNRSSLVAGHGLGWQRPFVPRFYYLRFQTGHRPAARFLRCGFQRLCTRLRKF